MEQQDIKIIEKHRKENYELDRLFKTHEEYEKKINDLELRKGLSVKEEKELHELKKLKLAGKDKIEAILENLR